MQASVSNVAETLPRAQPDARKGLGQRRFLIGGVVVLGAIAFLVFNTMRDTTMYYLTVSELLGRGEAAYGEQVRLGGKAKPDTIETDPKNMILRFVVVDDNNSIPVVYKGVVPDAFKPDADVVLEGKLTREGVFQATTLLAKCPSKYKPGT